MNCAMTIAVVAISLVAAVTPVEGQQQTPTRFHAVLDQARDNSINGPALFKSAERRATPLASAAIGGLVGGGLGYLVAGERFDLYHTSGVILGAAVGAMGGAQLESLETAARHTLFGAAIGGAVPMAISIANDGEFSAVYGVTLVLPVIGAWIGNGRGQ